MSAWQFLSSEYQKFKEQSSLPKPIVDGSFLISMGMDPSPEFSSIIEKAREAQLEGAFSDKVGARKFVKYLIFASVK